MSDDSVLNPGMMKAFAGMMGFVYPPFWGGLAVMIGVEAISELSSETSEGEEFSLEDLEEGDFSIETLDEVEY